MSKVWRDIITEDPRGGIIDLQSNQGFTIDNVTAYDFSGPTTADLFTIGKTTGSASAYGKISKSGRRGGTLGAGKVDIRLVTGECGLITIEQVDNATLNGCVIDVGLCSGVTIKDCGDTVSILNRLVDTMVIGVGSHVSPAPSRANTYARVDRVEVAGFLPLASTTWIEMSPALRLTLGSAANPVLAGQVVEVGFSASFDNAGNAVAVDVVSLGAAPTFSPTRTWSNGGLVGSNNGAMEWLALATGDAAVSGGSLLQVVQAGDIVNGVLTLTVYYRTPAASPVRQVLASADSLLTFWAVNRG